LQVLHDSSSKTLTHELQVEEGRSHVHFLRIETEAVADSMEMLFLVK
jgi:hypothetical protein